MISIIIKNLYKKFDDTELFNGLSLEFNAGQAYALFSPSGSGKTTLLRLISGLQNPDKGDIIFKNNGKIIHKPGISMVFQEDRLCEDFSAVDNIVFATKLSKTTATGELIKLLPENLIHKPVSKLSGGQRRRVCIVRAMNYEEASIILMDEPFTGLDIESKKISCNYILNKKADRLMILSTHDTEDLNFLGLTPVNF
ncbi:MAG: ATP-binding cassette domain-containing protein [Eubacteriales bacterium]|nr:ATP-binding cassette domain-containing protein [Eubacteriales bacterium]